MAASNREREGKKPNHTQPVAWEATPTAAAHPHTRCACIYKPKYYHLRHYREDAKHMPSVGNNPRPKARPPLLTIFVGGRNRRDFRLLLAMLAALVRPAAAGAVRSAACAAAPLASIPLSLPAAWTQGRASWPAAVSQRWYSAGSALAMAVRVKGKVGFVFFCLAFVRAPSCHKPERSYGGALHPIHLCTTR
jgi:hypothetical protein